MKQKELFGQLTLSEESNAPPILHLDGIPIKENQILLVKHEEGKFLGYAVLNPKAGWVLDCEEFVGHTYLNLRLSTNVIHEMTARIVKAEEIRAIIGHWPKKERT